MIKTTFNKAFFIALLSLLFITISFAFAACKPNKTALDINLVELNSTEFVFSGQEIKPEITVKNNNTIFVEGEDYVVFYENNINAGTAKLIVSALDSSKTLMGRAEKTFTITKKDVASTDITISSLTFSGNPQTMPEVSVRIGTKEFDNSNFNITISGGYPDTENTINISAKAGSNFVGSVTKNFVVNYMDLNAATFEVENATYNTEEQTPNFVMKMNGVALPSSLLEDLEVTYQNNILPTDEAQINVLVKNKNHYFEQNKQRTINFTIQKADISTTAQIASIEDSQYDGTTSYKIAPVVSAFGNTLAINEDFDVLYFRDGNEINNDVDFVDGGFITAQIIGKGNFVGTQEIQYFIRGIDITENPNLNIAIDDTNLIFSGYEQIPQINITLDGEEIFSYTTTYLSNINAGTNTAIVNITFIGNYAGTIQQTFSIAQKSIDEYLLTLLETESQYAPNGAEILCSLKAFEGAEELALNQDYVLEYANNQSVSVSPNFATVKAKGIGNYSGETAAQNFMVIQRELEENMLQNFETTFKFDGTEKKPTITIFVNNQLVSSDNYDVLYYSNYDEQIEATDFVLSGQTIFVEITGKNNLTSATIVKSYTIEQNELTANSTSVTLSQDVFDYDGNAKAPTINTILFCGNALNDENYDVNYERNTNAGTAQVVITGKNNVYGTITKEFTISPRDLSTLTITFVENLTYNAQVQNIVPTISGELVTQSDYNITYYAIIDDEKVMLSENEVINLVNAGTYEVNVIGRQNFAGTVSSTTIIQKIENKITQELKINNWKFGENPSIPNFQAEFGEPVYYYAPSETQDFARVVPETIGEYVCLATIPESTNYFAITCTNSFSITKCDLSNASISIKEISINDGTLETLNFDVYVYNTLLTSDDFEQNASLNDGVLTISLEAKNSSLVVYGEKEQEFEIKNAQSISINAENAYAFGSTAEISTNNQNAELKIYQKTSLNEVNNNAILDAGEYIAIASLCEDEQNYLLITQKEFVVMPQNYDENTILIQGINNPTYTGTSVLENLIITNTTLNQELELNKDYTLATEDDMISATGTEVSVQITFIGNYMGLITKQFTIQQKEIGEFERFSTPYTGEIVVCGVKPQDDTMIEGTDYEVLLYADQARTTLASNEQKTNVGLLYGLIKSNNANLLDCPFELEITKQHNEFLNKIFAEDFEFGDEITKPVVNAKFGETKIMFSSNGTDFEEWTNEQKPTSFGTYYVKAEVLGTDNYYSIVSTTFMFKITRQEIRQENITLSFTETEYQEGVSQVPTIVIKDKFENTLTAGTDYKVRYFKQINENERELIADPSTIIERGTYVVNITAKSGSNYQTTSDINIIFTII